MFSELGINVLFWLIKCCLHEQTFRVGMAEIGLTMTIGFCSNIHPFLWELYSWSAECMIKRNLYADDEVRIKLGWRRYALFELQSTLKSLWQRSYVFHTFPQICASLPEKTFSIPLINLWPWYYTNWWACSKPQSEKLRWWVALVLGWRHGCRSSHLKSYVSFKNRFCWLGSNF